MGTGPPNLQTQHHVMHRPQYALGPKEYNHRPACGWRRLIKPS